MLLSFSVLMCLLYIQKNTIVLGFTLIYKNNFVGHSRANIGGDRANLE